MNVLVSTDNEYAFQTCVMLKSLFENHRQSVEPIKVYALLRDVNESNKTKIEAFIRNCGHEPSLTEITDEDYAQIFANKYFDDIKKTHHLTMAAYNRLLVTQKIPEAVDKILYLDSDIIVNKPLFDLYNQLEENVSAVVIDGFTFKEKDFILLANNDLAKTKNIVAYARTFKRKIGISETSRYFNSGVMVLNLKWLRNNNFVERVKQHINTHEYEDADQSILNAILGKEVSFASFVYNCRPSDFGRNNKLFLRRQAYILHYGVKPWNDLRTTMSMKWWKYAFQTDCKMALSMLARNIANKMK